MGALTDMVRGRKKNETEKNKGEESNAGRAKDPPDDAEAGSEYSKVGRKSGGYDDDPEIEDDPEESGAGHARDASMAAFDSLADHLGIHEDKRADAHAALKLFVKHCK